MVARIQTLYLFLAGLLAVASMFFPFWSFSIPTLVFITDFAPFPDAGIMQVTSSYAAGIFSPLTAIAAIAAIFLYKKRDLQKKVILLGMLLFLGDLLSGLAAAHFLNEYLCTCVAFSHKPEAGLFILLPEPVLLWMALSGVKKDDKIANAYKRL
ncbi:MAG: DUF4293 domain-containing protein [Chlorobiaceae bacterium]|jgi:hypothetical protein|nr:DUF4293 domain-containing protein [Chlorobiaceae bacterium]NTV15954.1 DUF4293 domain-containing protein [Chlorobiaceae bacterium]